MKKFIGKFLLGSLLAGLLIVCMILGVYALTLHVYDDNYQKGFVYQYRAIQRADDNTPKCVVFGGSYATFAVDSDQLSEELAMPAFVFGVQSTMGMDYTIELLSEEIHEGDIIVYPYTSFGYDDYGMDLIFLSLDGQLDMTLDFLKNHPKEFLTNVPKATYMRLSGILRTAITEKLIAPEKVYLASGFDQETGNFILPRPEPIISEEEAATSGFDYSVENIDPEGIEILNDLNALCEEKGATLLIAFPPECETAVTYTAEEIAAYDKALDDLLDAELIMKQEDVFVPYEYVFNGSLHLNDQGKKVYTKLLAEDIEKACR